MVGGRLEPARPALRALLVIAGPAVHSVAGYEPSYRSWIGPAGRRAAVSNLLGTRMVDGPTRPATKPSVTARDGVGASSLRAASGRRGQTAQVEGELRGRRLRAITATSLAPMAKPMDCDTVTDAYLSANQGSQQPR